MASPGTSEHGTCDSEIVARPAGYAETDSARDVRTISDALTKPRILLIGKPSAYGALNRLAARLAAAETRAQQAESMGASNLSMMEAYRTEAMGAETRADEAEDRRRLQSEQREYAVGRMRKAELRMRAAEVRAAAAENVVNAATALLEVIDGGPGRYDAGEHSAACNDLQAALEALEAETQP